MALRKIVTNSINDDAVTGDKLSNDMLGGITPVGGIILWSGAVASIGTGSLVNWALCDGTNGTPNLTDKFVVGAGSGYAVSATGGSANAVLVAHSHGITDSGHDHDIEVLTDATVGSPNGSVDQNPTSNAVTATSTGSISTETTGISINTTGLNASGATANAQTGTNANLPPYFALAYIMRVS